MEKIEALESKGIGLIVTILERPINPILFRGLSIKNHHLFCRNFTAPSLQNMEKAFEKMEKYLFEKRKGVIMHCRGGRGRTGTVLACFMVKWGLNMGFCKDGNTLDLGKAKGATAKEAIQKTRNRIQGAIEVSSQIDRVHEFEKYMRKL